MQFIQSLTEARFFRYQDNFDGKHVSSLATTLYLLLLLLEATRRYDKSYAQNYCKTTFLYGDFDGIRSYSTDIHNLIAVLNNKKYQNRIIHDRNIHIPEFALKRYFRDVMWDSRESPINRSFFIQLSGDLGVTDGNTKTVRRTLIDYGAYSQQEYWDATERINRRLNDLAINCDLHWHWKSNLRNHIPHS